MAYVYKHIRKDNNEIFYIGKGTPDDIKQLIIKKIVGF